MGGGPVGGVGGQPRGVLCTVRGGSARGCVDTIMSLGCAPDWSGGCGRRGQGSSTSGAAWRDAPMRVRTLAPNVPSSI
jgi:hypothetical protein